MIISIADTSISGLRICDGINSDSGNMILKSGFAVSGVKLSRSVLVYFEDDGAD